MSPAAEEPNRAARTLVRALALAAALLACQGCGPSDPLDTVVDDSTPISFSMWRAKASESLTGEQLRDFDEACQEIRFQIMGRGDVTGQEAIEAQAKETIDGQSVRSVLAQGLGRRLQRLEEERAHRLKSIRYNEGIQTRPDDTRSQRYLAELHERQLKEVGDEAAEIERLKGRLRADGLPDTPPPPSGESADQALEPGTLDQPPVPVR